MRMRHALSLIFVVATFAMAAPAQDEAGPAKPLSPRPRSDGKSGQDLFIASLVRQLGDGRWKVRNAAAEQLARMGKPAIPALRAALASDDLEVVVRARLIISEILGLAKKGLAPMRAEIGEAFEKADYATMADKAKLLVDASESPSMHDWLWLGHASQLADDWPGAVKAYRGVVHLLDAELESGVKEVVAPQPIRKGLGRGGGAVVILGPVRPAGPVMYTEAERKGLLNKRTLLATWIARFERFEMKDASAAAKTLRDAVAQLEKSRTKPDSIWFDALKQTIEAHVALGDLGGAVTYCKKRQQALDTRTNHKKRVDPDELGKLLASLPPDKPLPDIPWLYVLTEDKPTATLTPDDEATMARAYQPYIVGHPNWKYAFAPPPGKEFAALEFACDIEQIKPRHGGHFSCFFLTPEGSVSLGRIDWKGPERTGRATLNKTFKVPPGVKVVHINTGTWKGAFTMHRIDVKATLRPASSTAPSEPAGSWFQAEALPAGGELTWGDRKLHSERAYGGMPPRKARLRYEVKGREDVFEADFEVKPGRRYGIFVNLDSPFTSTQTNLELKSATIPPARLSVVRQADGKWLAVWGAEGGKIMLATSKDLVRWSKPRVAPFCSVFANIEPGTFADAEGTVWIAFLTNRLHLQESNSASYGMWLTSTRDGKTFTPIRVISRRAAQTGGWPHGAPRLLRTKHGRARLYWKDQCADANSFEELREFETIDIGDPDPRAPRSGHISLDAEGRFHIVFRSRKLVRHAVSDDGRTWGKPAVIHEAQAPYGPEYPQLIHTPAGAALVYSASSGAYIVPVDLTHASGNEAGREADSAIQFTNHVIPLAGSRAGLTPEGKLFVLVGRDTTWLLRADAKDITAVK